MRVEVSWGNQDGNEFKVPWRPTAEGSTLVCCRGCYCQRDFAWLPTRIQELVSNKQIKGSWFPRLTISDVARSRPNPNQYVVFAFSDPWRKRGAARLITSKKDRSSRSNSKFMKRNWVYPPSAVRDTTWMWTRYPNIKYPGKLLYNCRRIWAIKAVSPFCWKRQHFAWHGWAYPAVWSRQSQGGRLNHRAGVWK